ncbi:MAG: hypothetical protein AAF919_01875 [Pseudomonadota bacterium]
MLEVTAVPALRARLWVKLIEIVLQLRPKALYRCCFQPDPRLNHAMRWYTRMGRRVALSELADLLWCAGPRRAG